MATLAAQVPVSDEALAVRRKWRWAAILLQVEAFGALMMGALFLIRSTATVSPAAQLMGLTAAAVLFPFAAAIERGNRNAGLVLAVLYSLRVFQFVAAPTSTFMRMAPLILIEGLVFGRAVIAMTKPGAPPAEQPKRSRGAHLVVMVLPILVAATLFSQGSRQHLTAAVHGTPDDAVRIAHVLGWVLVFCGIGLVLLHELPSRISMALGRGAVSVKRPGWVDALDAFTVPSFPTKLPWTLQVRMDFAIGAVTLIASVWVLHWMSDAMSQSGVMLVPGVLIFPIVALLCIPLGFVWIGIGIAEIRGKPWVRKLRFIAAFPLLLVGIFAAPIFASILKDLALSALRKTL